MVVPNAGEILFSVIFSYMGALEFFFIARNLYHWAFKHHKRMLELTNDSESLNELQEKIKTAINEAKEKELYGFNAMKDGILYKDGFRVSPNSDVVKNERHVIGSSRNSIEDNLDESKKPEVHQKQNLIESNLKSQTELIQEKQKHEENQYAGLQEVIEEPCVKKQIKYNETLDYKESNDNTAADNERTNLSQTIKTQFNQTGSEQISLKSDLLTPDRPNISNLGKSEDSSSNEPASNRSEFSTQQSSSIETTISAAEMHFDEYERPEPDGQDVNDSQQYSDEYLRSLDGIKYRPLVRDDGTGRRRAFKKRRSSGDSTSSRESRASREEEVKMFTSLEEEEFESIKRGDSDYTPIRYSSDPNLKVTKHTKRHKRSPIKGSKESEESRSSLDMLDEEDGSPWGDVKPEHYKDMEFWKREKATSIEEENVEDNSNEIEEEQENQPSNADAVEKCVSPSPAKNIPKMSSFEEATHSQNENMVSSIQRKLSQDMEVSDEQKLKSENMETTNSGKNVSTNDFDASLSSLVENSASNQNQKSLETDENSIHDQNTDDHIERQSTKLRRSPRQDDMEYYVEQFIEEEKRASRTPSPRMSSPEKNQGEINLPSNTELEPTTPESAGNSSKHEYNKSISNTTPAIEIDYAPDVENSDLHFDNDDESEDEAKCASGDLLEGISDFYDFNASINPSRSSSRPSSRSSSRPQSRSSNRSSKSPAPIFKKLQENNHRIVSPYQKRSKSRSKSPFKFNAGKGIPGLSDWYDFNVMLNTHAYGNYIENERIVHQTSTDFIVSQLKKNNELENINSNTSKSQIFLENIKNDRKSKSKSLTPDIIEDSNNNAEILIKKEQSLSPSKSIESFKLSIISSQSPDKNSERTESPIFESEPPTPQFPRSISAEWKHTERIKEEFKQKFRRSKYIGESVDFSNEFENLREQTRHFKRSRSRSRTPTDEDIQNIILSEPKTQQKLQDKILAEITKTTLNYQEFTKDVNYDFLEHERRGSDSALLKHPEFIVQFQDSHIKNGDCDNDINLEAEEYHHFRRFSLNQEAQIEEYPSDEYIYQYIEEIDLNEKSISNIEKDEQNELDLREKQTVEISSVSLENVNELVDQGGIDDQEDSGSDDERQTVVEVDDEIDEDIWDYEKLDEFNEQSECEEADREVDRFINRSAKDWKEEGAVGGDNWGISDNKELENTANIEEMYDEALRYIEEGGIENDYDNIIEEMNNEEKIKNEILNNNNDDLSIKTEDFIDEILNDDKKYEILSPRSKTKYYNIKTTTRDFIDHEKEDDVPYYVTTSTVVHHNTTSTRLRSRYGLPPPTTFRNFDYDDEISVDLNYKPKKEYNWRKNFKIDDDNYNNDIGNRENLERKMSLSNSEDTNGHEEFQHYLDTRKYSLGGESITLYSRSLESEERQLEIISSSENVEISEINNEENKESSQIDRNVSLSSQHSEEINEETKAENFVQEIDQSSDVLPKKKKSKKKSRKGSKASLGDDEIIKVRKGSKASLGDDEVIKMRKGSIPSLNDDEINFSLQNDNLEKINEEDKTDSSLKKKTKKKKKVKIETTSENISSDINLPIIKPKEFSEQQNLMKSEESQMKQVENHISDLKDDDTERTLLPLIPESSSSSSSNNNQNNLEKTSQSATYKKNNSSSSQSKSTTETNNEIKPSTTTSIQENSDSGVYELIKDGSMYPWF